MDKNIERPSDYVVLNLQDEEEEAEKVATNIISFLDEKYEFDDVIKIAEWINYLATQE